MPKHIDDKPHNANQLMTNRIKDELNDRMRESAMEINVVYRDGNVHMSGMVDVLSERKFAEEIVSKLEGVRRIENKITIAMDSNITDKHIEKEVIEKLHHGNEAIAGIGAKVERGVVSLMGHVDTLRECHIAMRMTSEVRGVKDVVNNINIETQGKYTDDTISNKILEELSKSPLDYRDITRRVSNGEVTLWGALDSHKDIEMAKEIAMGVEGVIKVRNNMHVAKNR